MSVTLPGLKLAVALCTDELAHFLEGFSQTTSTDSTPDDGSDGNGTVTINVSFRAPLGERLVFYASMRPDDADPIEWLYIVKLQHHDGSEHDPMPQHWPHKWEDDQQEWWATDSRTRAFIAAEKTSTFRCDDGTGKWKKKPSYIISFQHEMAEPAQCANEPPVKIQLTPMHVPVPRERADDDEEDGSNKRLKMDPDSEQHADAAPPAAARRHQESSSVTLGDGTDDEEADRPLAQLLQFKSEYAEQQIESFGRRRQEERKDDDEAVRGILELVQGERAKVLKKLSECERNIEAIPVQAEERLADEQHRFNDEMEKHRKTIKNTEAKMERRELDFEAWKTEDAKTTASELNRATIERGVLAERSRRLKRQVETAEAKLGKKRGPAPTDLVLTLPDSDDEE